LLKFKHFSELLNHFSEFLKIEGAKYQAVDIFRAIIKVFAITHMLALILCSLSYFEGEILSINNNWIFIYKLNDKHWSEIYIGAFQYILKTYLGNSNFLVESYLEKLYIVFVNAFGIIM